MLIWTVEIWLTTPEGASIPSGHSWSVVVVNRRLFGDESDLHFWTVASHYLQSFAQARQLSVSTADGQAQSEGTQPAAQNHLDICHDVLCESSYFQVSRWRPNHISLFTPAPSFDATSMMLWRDNAALTFAEMLSWRKGTLPMKWRESQYKGCCKGHCVEKILRIN